MSSCGNFEEVDTWCWLRVVFSLVEFAFLLSAYGMGKDPSRLAFFLTVLRLQSEPFFFPPRQHLPGKFLGIR